MGFNNEDYLKGQIDKQYHQPKESSVKQSITNKPAEIEESLMEKVISSDIETLQLMVKQEKATYLDIAKSFWNQVIQNKKYNAVISLNPDVLKQAEGLNYDESHDLMYGIPVLVKDNIAVKGLPTTAGAAVLKDFYPDKDAEIIRQVKDKGALVLGKTNLSEWANFMSSDSSNGYSAIGGQTKNARGEFDVGGSSSGSAVAAALCMAPVTIGSETSGSIIYPASQNGTVGLKPTLGLVSQEGIIPISETHDTAGPMALTVKDTYTLFKAMTEVEDSADWRADSLSSVKVGIIDNEAIKEVYRTGDNEILADVQKELSALEAVCSTIVLDDEALKVNYFPILKHEFKLGVQSYFEPYKEFGLTLDEVFSFNAANEPDFAPYNQELIRQSSEDSTTKEEMAEAIQFNQKTAKKALDKAFESVDVLITLSNYATVLYAAAGYPALTVPGNKRSTGEPVGITLIGKHNQDVQLLEWAYAYEQQLKVQP